jgi:hypothetical protein
MPTILPYLHSNVVTELLLFYPYFKCEVWNLKVLNYSVGDSLASAVAAVLVQRECL